MAFTIWTSSIIKAYSSTATAKKKFLSTNFCFWSSLVWKKTWSISFTFVNLNQSVQNVI